MSTSSRPKAATRSSSSASAEWFWLDLLGRRPRSSRSLVGFFLMRGVLAADQGTPKMIEIADGDPGGRDGLPPAPVPDHRRHPDPARDRRVRHRRPRSSSPTTATVALVGLSFAQSGLFRTLAFVAGCVMSGLTGFIGMSLAVRGNVRTAAAARRRARCPPPCKVAFRTGGVAGMFTVGLGLLGATIIIMIFQNTASAILIGFGFGGSLLALFLRVGGGIFTKAADVGADLVGKVEAGHPRGRPAQPGHHRRQRGRQRRRLRRHGRRPLRELRGHARRLDHPRRRRLPVDRR